MEVQAMKKLQHRDLLRGSMQLLKYQEKKRSSWTGQKHI